MDSELIVNVTDSNLHPCYEAQARSYTFATNPSVGCVLLYVFIGLMSVGTVFGNLLVCVSILYFKQLHTPTNSLILSLAVADLLVGVIVFPFSMAVTVTSCYFHENMYCKIRGTFDITLSTSSILNLCCISIDRYYAVCHPLVYRSKITDRVIGGMITVSWGVAVFIGVGVTVAGFNQGKCEDTCLIDMLISTTLACLFSFYIPVVIMLSIYLKIFLVAQQQVNSIQSTKVGAAAASKMERKATKTLATVMGVFLLCWTPYFLCIIFQPLIFDKTPVAVIETLNWFTLFNSMLNPFIYAFFYSWFRSAFKMIISGKILKEKLSNSKLL